jgi:small conductance mechanosensitive channel
VGDRVRLQGGPVGGRVEGVVSSLGLLYLTLAVGEDSIMVPNSVVLSLAVMPVREPDSVDLRARLRAEVRPSEVQDALERHVNTAIRAEPDIMLEEIDGDEVVVRIAATPQRPAEGRQLADQILSAVAALGRDGSNGRPPDPDHRARTPDGAAARTPDRAQRAER